MKFLKERLLIKSNQVRFFLLIILLVNFAALAQVFIPFGYWGNKEQIVVSPADPVYLQTGDLQTFTISGGNLPDGYDWYITAAGLADGATVATPPDVTVDYTARLTANTADVLTIVAGNYVTNVNIYAYDPITIAPATVVMAINTTTNFTTTQGCLNATCSGGTPTWSVVSGGGSINSSGVYTAPNFNTTAIIQVADAIGNTAQATVTVSSTLVINPASLVLPIYSTANYSAAVGGVPYNYSLFAGTGSINCSGTLNGVHTNIVTTITVNSTAGCPSRGDLIIGTERICYTGTTATTFTGATRGCASTIAAAYLNGTAFNINNCSSSTTGTHTNAVTTINVNSTSGCPAKGAFLIGTETICYNGITATTFTGATRGCGGTTAAAYNVVTAYNLNRAVYTGGSATGSATVRVTDASASTADSAVTLIQPLQIAQGYAFTCVLYSNGSVKCWGENNGGQLGLGNTTSVGTLGTSQGSGIPFVNLGAGRTATQIEAGWYHVCALLDNSTVKCWGQNTYGQLGQGTVANIGNTSVNDIANTAAIVFPGGRTPNEIFVFGYTSCAKFTDTTSTCWGLNTSGQLGQGTVTTVYSPPAVINYGAGVYAVQLAGGTDFTCARLSNATVKCWGRNANGQLGRGDTVTQSVSPSTLAAINLGGGRTATFIGAGNDSTGTTGSGTACAVLDNGTIACWGRGSNGQIGDAGSTDRTSPTQTSALGFTAAKVYGARRVICAVSTTNFVKCWGQNSRGQLMQGSTSTMNAANYCNTTLSGAHTSAVTTITASAAISGNCPASNGKIVIGTEVICYTGKSGSTFTGATRGCDGTTAAAHNNADPVIEIINWGTGVGYLDIGIAGRTGCMITGNGTNDNNRIKCFGTGANSGGTAVGAVLYPALGSTTYLGDTSTELGDGLPFVNH